MDIAVNYFAVLVSGITAMVLGALWYGPVFGKLWIRLMGWSPQKIEEQKKKSGMGKPYAFGFLGALVTAYVLAHFVARWDVKNALETFQVSFWPWLGFIVTTLLGSVLGRANPSSSSRLTNYIPVKRCLWILQPRLSREAGFWFCV